MYSEGDISEGTGATNTLRTRTTTKVNKKTSRLARVGPSARLADLVRALNAIRATPKDLIAILQALKKAGSLKAELEII